MKTTLNRILAPDNDLFRSAIERQPIPEDGTRRLMDDLDFLDRLQAGELSTTEHEQLLQELDRDPESRELLAEMIREEIITFDEVGLPAECIDNPSIAPVEPPITPRPVLQNPSNSLTHALSASFAETTRSIEPDASQWRPESEIPTPGRRWFSVGRMGVIASVAAMIAVAVLLPERSSPTTLSRSSSLYDYGIPLPDIAVTDASKTMTPDRSKSNEKLEPVSADVQRLELQSLQQQLLKAVVQNPKSDVAHLNLGEFYLAHQIFADALVEFELAVQLNGTNASAHAGLGMAVFLNSEIGAEEQVTIVALRHFHKALELDPLHVGAHISIAYLEFRQSHFDEAEKHLQAADRLTADPVLKGRINVLLKSMTKASTE